MVPTPSTTSAAKVCIRCGVDCSTRLRVKDLRGRYTCRDCHDALRREGAPAAPVAIIVAADPGAVGGPGRAEDPGIVGGLAGVASPAEAQSDSGLLDALLADALRRQAAPPVSSPCPGCGHPPAADAAICITRGYNPRTGAAIQTRMVEVEAAEARRLESMEFLKPMVVVALAVPGVCCFLTIHKNMTGLTVPKYLTVYLLSIVVSTAVYAFFCLLRLGFRAPLALGGFASRPSSPPATSSASHSGSSAASIPSAMGESAWFSPSACASGCCTTSLIWISSTQSSSASP